MKHSKSVNTIANAAIPKANHGSKQKTQVTITKT